MELLKEKNINDVLVIGGGVIPMEDIPALKDAGIAAIFTPGTPTTETIDFIKNNLKRSA
jgi:methylmalonyl-CoA mutase C-terminal domain/subunit